MNKLKTWCEKKFTDIIFLWKLILYSYIIGSILGISTFVRGIIQYENYIEIIGFELLIFHIIYFILAAIILYCIHNKKRMAYDFSIVLLFAVIIDSVHTFIEGIGISSTLYLVGEIFFTLIQIIIIILLYSHRDKFYVRQNRK